MNAGFFLRAMARESRGARGRLFFFTLCLAIGVAAVVAVSGLVEAIRDGIRDKSRELLAAELRVEARRALPAELDEFFAGLPGAERVDVREMATMVTRPDGGSELAQLKVVAGRYPFFGTLETEPARPMAELLDAETAVVGPELGVAAGEEVRIGGTAFRVAGIVTKEPDRLDFIGVMGPRIFLAPAALERTKLLGFGSRVRYRALLRFAGDPSPAALADIERRMRAAVPGSEYLRVQTHYDAQPGVRRALDRVESYLGLVALLSLVLGGVGVAQIVRAWLAGRTQAVAVLRCLGFRPREVMVLFLGHVLALAFLGSVAGGLLGSGLVPVIAGITGDVLPPVEFGIWQPLALLRGVLLGMGIATLFSLPPLTAVWRVSPARVLRDDAEPLPPRRGVRIAAALALFLGVFGSAWAQAGSALLGIAFAGGLFCVGGALVAGAWLVMRSVGRLPRDRVSPYLRHGLAALARPGAGTTGAIVALGLGVMVVTSMYLVESRLGTGLVEAVPADAPTVFLVDVQPGQSEGVMDALADAGAEAVDSVPVVMARLSEIDGRPIEDLVGDRDGGRARWVLTREQRLTWRAELPPDNRIVAGALWSDPARAEVSIEKRFAENLGVDIGSTILFDVQGVPIELLVSSIRTVEWQSFGINFFLVVEPGVLDRAPQMRLVGARVDIAAEQTLQDRLAQHHPNVTVLRVRSIIERVGGILERMSQGVRMLGAFTILAGIAILAGAISASTLRRGREAALLKTLGVTRRGVTGLFAVEYGLSGLVAGTIGVGGAFLLSWAFLEHVVELGADLPYAAIPLVAIASAALTVACGIAASGRALATRPLESLRG